MQNTGRMQSHMKVHFPQRIRRDEMALSSSTLLQYKSRYVTVLLIELKMAKFSSCTQSHFPSNPSPLTGNTAMSACLNNETMKMVDRVVGLTAENSTIILNTFSRNQWYISILRIQPLFFCKYVTLLLYKVKGSNGKHFKFDQSYSTMIKKDLFYTFVRGMPLQGYSSIEFFHKRFTSDRYISFFNQPSFFCKYISVVW